MTSTFDETKHYLGKLCIRGHDAGDGQSWRHKGHNNCVTCTRDRARSWNAENPDRRREINSDRNARRKAEGFNRRDHHPFAAHAASVSGRARTKGLATDVSAALLREMWATQNGLCYWTGRPLDFYVGGAKHPMRPSIDRLEPALGYVAGNIVWASNFANRARGELPAEQFRQLLISFGILAPTLERQP